MGEDRARAEVIFDFAKVHCAPFSPRLWSDISRKVARVPSPPASPTPVAQSTSSTDPDLTDATLAIAAAEASSAQLTQELGRQKAGDPTPARGLH